MPTIGTRSVDLHTVDRDETIYKEASHTVSHTSLVALRRTLPTKATNPTRTNVRFERGFPVTGEEGGEEPVVVSIAVTVPPGVTTADVTTYVNAALTDAAAVAGSIAVTGDIHL